ncbi:MAG: hypothetical protein SGJ02_09930 [bacterium]|nr:hypothetical protein [bacterium]
MAPLQEYITESEAAKLCSISLNTLNRFVETGYLQVEKDSDGLRLFAKNELQRVFGIADATFQEIKSKISPQFAFVGNGIAEPIIEQDFSTPQTVATPSTTPMVEITPLVEPEMEKSEPKRPHLHVVKPEENVKPEVKISEPVAIEREPIRSKEVETLEFEASKLKNIVGMLEKILDIRETEITSLKEQIKWLQERIEKMEDRSSREQLLLLAESETVRKLVLQNRRSPIRAALEWLGLADQTDYKSTINVEPEQR